MESVELPAAIKRQRLEPEQPRTEAGFIKQFGEPDQPRQCRRQAQPPKRCRSARSQHGHRQEERGAHLDDAVLLQQQGAYARGEDSHDCSGERNRTHHSYRACQQPATLLHVRRSVMRYRADNLRHGPLLSQNCQVNVT